MAFILITLILYLIRCFFILYLNNKLSDMSREDLYNNKPHEWYFKFCVEEFMFDPKTWKIWSVNTAYTYLKNHA